MKHTNLTYNAYLFAKAAHERVGQLRHYTDEPYIVHPSAVAELVAAHGGDEEMIAAAFLHDTVEDTGVELAEIERRFGPGVAGLVDELTDVAKREEGNRDFRVGLNRAHSAKASARGQTVKLADLIENGKDIMEHDAHFAARYMPEKKALLAVLTKGHPELRKLAAAVVERWESGQ